MYLAHDLEQMTGTNRAGRAYRRDWRLVTYRVARTDDGELRWEVESRGDWRSNWLGVNFISGMTRARRDALRGVPFIAAVRHLKKVTGREAARLTGLPAWNALDFLREQELDADGVQNHTALAAKAKKRTTKRG